MFEIFIYIKEQFTQLKVLFNISFKFMLFINDILYVYYYEVYSEITHNMYIGLENLNFILSVKFQT